MPKMTVGKLLKVPSYRFRRDLEQTDPFQALLEGFDGTNSNTPRRLFQPIFDKAGQSNSSVESYFTLNDEGYAQPGSWHRYGSCLKPPRELNIYYMESSFITDAYSPGDWQAIVEGISEALAGKRLMITTSVGGVTIPYPQTSADDSLLVWNNEPGAFLGGKILDIFLGAEMPFDSNYATVVTIPNTGEYGETRTVTPPVGDNVDVFGPTIWWGNEAQKRLDVKDDFTSWSRVFVRNTKYEETEGYIGPALDAFSPSEIMAIREADEVSTYMEESIASDEELIDVVVGIAESFFA